MISDDIAGKLSNNIVILQQIEDCRDRNDTVLQFTVDPVTFGYVTSGNQASAPAYSLNDLKNLLDDDLIKNFSLTSSTNELIFSAVNCSMLMSMRVLTSMRKKSWMILTSNAYLDIYTNCIVKTFYFEKYSQAKLFAVSSPSALSGSSIPSFAPRTSTYKRPSSIDSNKQRSDSDPLSPELDTSNGSYQPLPPRSPTGRAPLDFNTDSQSSPMSQPLRRDSIGRRQPPPPPSFIKADSTGSISELSSPKNSAAAASFQPVPVSRNGPQNTSTSSVDLSDPEESGNSNYRANNVPKHFNQGSYNSGQNESKKVSQPKNNPPSSVPSASLVAAAQAASGSPNHWDGPAEPANVEHSNTHSQSSNSLQNNPEPSNNQNSVNNISTPAKNFSTPVPTPAHENAPHTENNEHIEEAAPASFSAVAREEKILFASPVTMMNNMRNTQSMPVIPTDTITSPGDKGNKNSEYFKKLKEAQESEKQRQLEEESKMSAYELQKKREAEAEVQQHENSKTAHYARLGATFVNRGSPLVGGPAGRGGPVPTGRLGGRGGNR